MATVVVITALLKVSGNSIWVRLHKTTKFSQIWSTATFCVYVKCLLTISADVMSLLYIFLGSLQLVVEYLHILLF